MDNRTLHTISGELNRGLAPRAYRRTPVEEFPDLAPDLAPGLVMSTLRSSRVWGGMAWRRAFAGHGDQSAPARRMVGRLLADTNRADDAQWVTAELISNALRHTRSGQERGFFVVEVLRGTEVARIVVYDLGGGQVPDFSRTPGSELAEHGRGLAGVAELALRVGAVGDAVTGHAVWAELALAGEAVQADVAVGEAVRGPQPGGSRELVPMHAGEVAMGPERAAAGTGSWLVGYEGPAGYLPDASRVPAKRPGSSGGKEEIGGLDPSTCVQVVG